jgi:predicted flap endonuclease-1-like 5' DNA nuclease
MTHGEIGSKADQNTLRVEPTKGEWRSMARVIQIEGIGPAYRELLRHTAGITTTEALLKACKTPLQRQELAAKVGVSEQHMLEWANRADLFRIKGVGEEYSDLLEAAGVDTVVELAQRNPQNLHVTLKETNAARAVVRRLPTLKQVQDWVRQAKKLPRVLTY